jgi:hypothetical protein
MILLGSVSVGTQDLDILWMLSNLPKLEVSLLPKIRRLNRTIQERQFFLSQPTQILLQLPNLIKCSQHPNVWLTKHGMPNTDVQWLLPRPMSEMISIFEKNGTTFLFSGCVEHNFLNLVQCLHQWNIIL